MEAALHNLVPKMIPANVTFSVYNLRSKSELLRKLQPRLRALHNYIRENERIVVLLDEDREDCREIKQQLENIAQSAGFNTKSQRDSVGRFVLVNRIVIEELEAWFFGDENAVVSAYPRVRVFSAREPYRNPDAIKGGTCEALGRLLKYHGYHTGGFPKIEVARSISQFMEPNKNTSRSFQVFHNGLRAIISQENQ